MATAYCPTQLPRQYRRRWGVSRPCSGWARVGPPRPRHRGRSAPIGVVGRLRWGIIAGAIRGGRGPRRGGGEPLGHRHRSAARVAPRRPAARRPDRLSGALAPLGCGGAHLGARFALRCRQRLSRPDVGYPAVPLAGQPVHRRSVRPGPLVLGAGLLSPPSPATDRDRTVSRRSEPSSRTALMGEQPNPWEGLPPQDATSRHRGAKPCRRYGLSGKISLLSPG